MLVENTATLRLYVNVNLNFKFESISTHIADAEREILIPNIDEEQYPVLESDNLEGKLLEARKLAQRAVSCIALAKYMVEGQLQTDNDGISTIGRNENRTAAYDYQLKQNIAQLSERGGKAMESLLTLMASNQDDFAEYIASDAYIQNAKGLIKSAKAFSKIYSIYNSTLTFMALRPELETVEETMLIPKLTLPLYNVLLTVSDASLTAEQRALKAAALRALVFQTVANVIELQQAIELSSTGLRLNYASSFINASYYTPPTLEQQQRAYQAALKRAQVYWDEVEKMAAVELGIEPDSLSGSPIVSTPKIVAL